jgi:hypothetical protein
MSNTNNTIEILTRGVQGVRGPTGVQGVTGAPGVNLITNTWTNGFIAGGTGINDLIYQIPELPASTTYFNYTESGNFVFVDCQILFSEFNVASVPAGKVLSFRLPHASQKNTFICLGTHISPTGANTTKCLQAYGGFKAGSKIVKITYPADSPGVSNWVFTPHQISAALPPGEKFIFNFWYQKGTEVVDTVKPVITLIGNNPININEGDSFSDPGANVSDNVDDTTVIYGAGTIDTSIAGNYNITYSATDSAGNSAIQVTRDVIVNVVP